MKYAGKKLVSLLMTLLFVSFLVFWAFAVIPGDPALAQLGTNATPERLEALREEMGLNVPFLQRYMRWLLHFCKGDLGQSYSYHIPVSDMILEKLPISLCMTGMAFVMVLLISIPLGILSAKHRGGKLDTVICAGNQVLMSVPPFFSGILITLLFGMVLHWFTPGGFVSMQQNPAGFFGYLLFPAFAIALPKAAMAVKMLRSALVTELGKDYPRTAYSRGNTRNQVLYGHVLKNAMIPVLTFFGMALSDILTGSIIIEQVFGIPGIGRILLTSIMNRDYPVVEAIIMLMAITVIVVNFLVDLLYRKLDPQIHVET